MKLTEYLAAALVLGTVFVPAIASAVPPNFVQGGNSFGTQATLGTNDNFPLIFETNGTERLRVDETGNVGIGIQNPEARLDINGDVRILFGNNQGGDLLLQPTQGQPQPGNIEFRDGEGGQLATISYESSEDGLWLQVPNSETGASGIIFVSAFNGNITIGDAGPFSEPEGTLQIVREVQNSTLYIGSSDNSTNNTQRPGCLVLGDSDGDGVTYITANDGVLSATTTKPSICD